MLIMRKENKNKNIRTVKKGFTLVELLFVLFIISMSIGLTLASFRDSKPLDEVEAATRMVSAMIREAQNNSLVGKQQVSAGVLTNICLNGLEWTSNSANSAVFRLFSYRSVACSAAGKINGRSETLKNVRLMPAPGVGSRITFSVPGGGVSNTGFSSSGTAIADLKIESSVNNAIFSRVCVYATGRVEEVLGSPAGCP